MYTHISMFRFRDRSKLEEHREEIRQMLLTFPQHIPQICGYQVFDGCLPHPPGKEDTPLLFCDLIQIITFDSLDALTAYPRNPWHQAMVTATDHLMDRVCIMDYRS